MRHTFFQQLAVGRLKIAWIAKVVESLLDLSYVLEHEKAKLSIYDRSNGICRIPPPLPCSLLFPPPVNNEAYLESQVEWAGERENKKRKNRSNK